MRYVWLVELFFVVFCRLERGSGRAEGTGEAALSRLTRTADKRTARLVVEATAGLLTGSSYVPSPTSSPFLFTAFHRLRKNQRCTVSGSIPRAFAHALLDSRVGTRLSLCQAVSNSLRSASDSLWNWNGFALGIFGNPRSLAEAATKRVGSKVET
jgi:hypothetical protein